MSLSSPARIHSKLRRSRLRFNLLSSISIAFFLTLAVTLAWLLPTALMAQTQPQIQSLPKAPGGEVFTLTPTPGSFTEPSVAVNPNNPRQVVAVYQDNARASYSEDEGGSWHPGGNVAP
jgi:hypothetical protein